ncbi:MAG TPA: lysylphosphatidylglycerol synthase transmembrane domain-containing protein, partial [Kofleriaceae bacterium]|nr:lysylphosphatidylglycerol synthase transmembrane domain-containing protein [Kofleriaceae bacterium]
MTRTTWQRWGWVVRWGGTALGIAYVARLIDPEDVRRAAARISLAAIAAAIGLVALNVVCGALRWRALLAAYGAESRPNVARATALYFGSFFYNNYLPGAVAGDVVRGVVTREVFGARGATAGLAVVLVERALGLAAVFALLAGGLAATAGAIDPGALWWWAALGVPGSLAIVLALPVARRIAPRLPRRLRAIAERVPALSNPGGFVAAAAWSVATQLCVALAGWILLRAIDPSVGLGAALLIVPLAAATAFVPITVGGAGAREAVYVTLGASLFAMPRGDALAASLALWLAHLVVGAIGGAI